MTAAEVAAARLVDTATLAVWLGITPREVRRQVTAGELVAVYRSSAGQRGRPGLWFDLNNLRGELTDDRALADIGH